MDIPPVDALSQALRFFTLLRLISARQSGKRLGCPELAAACNCSTKTVQRDIKALQFAQIPIDYQRNERAYVLLDGRTQPLLVHITITDALALALLRGLVAEQVAFPFTDEVHIALDKLTGGVASALRIQMEAVAAAWSELGGMARDYSQAPLRTLLVALARRRTIEMVYASRSSGKTDRRLADPYRIDRRDGRYLEVQMWCHKNREVRTFALDRILEARVTDDVFTLRPWQSNDAGVVGGLRGGERTVLIARFDAEVATFARERRWPFAAQWEELPDGGLILRGEVQGTDGIVRELLSWRRHVTVLGGPELRKCIADEVRAIAALYETKESRAK